MIDTQNKNIELTFEQLQQIDATNKFPTLNYTYSLGTITITDGAPPVISIYSFHN